MRGTICFDFDGVIHSYKTRWINAITIPDLPVPGIKEAIEDIRKAGYEVVVVSTRCKTEEGIKAVKAYLDMHRIVVDSVQMQKPPAVCYIDDRAICFNGRSEELLDQIENFKPWNKR